MRKRTRSEITSETVLLDREQAAQIFSIGYTTLSRIAEEIGARVKIGKRVLYHREKLENYFNSLVE
jgi:hypothetical protein